MHSHSLIPALFLLAATPAFSGTLEISPVRVQLIGKERAATLTVRNTGSEDVNVQVRTVDWTQAGGSDQMSPSGILKASPPLVLLKPGQAQVVRVVAEGAPDTGHEQAFRLILDEIPPSTPKQVTGVKTAIRALVPVFITPSTSAKPALTWSAVRSADGVVLTARNSGDTRERLTGLSVTDGQAPVADDLSGYILSGAERSWTIKTAATGSLKIAAEGDYGSVTANVSVTSQP